MSSEREAAGLISFGEIMREPLLPVEWIVEPLLVQGDRALWFGAFGSLKSWILLHLAMHLAAGRDWLGFPVPAPKRVLYIDEEMNERTLRRRVKRLGLGAGLDGKDLSLKYRSRQGVKFTKAGAETLLDVLEKCEFDPDVIIVETLRRVLVGSENSAADMATFWNAAEPILRTGKTLIITHHMKKPSDEGEGATRDQASGSTDILAGADAGFGIRRAGEKQVTVECVKLREAEIGKPFGVSLHAVDPDGPVELKAGDATLDATEQEALDHINAFLDAAPDQTAKSGEIETCLKERMGLSHGTIYDLLPRLKSMGHLRKVKHGTWTKGAGEPSA